MPRILLQQGTNLVNKFALLLHKCRFAQDSRDKPENDNKVKCATSGNDSVDHRKKTTLTFKGLDVVRQYAALLERRVQNSTRARKAQAVTRQTKHIRNLLLQCASDATGFLSDVYKKSTRARKFLADGVQYGRSMIEMLGVLAIIAVLSVGGIAGYSKAMEKYKLNKWKEDLVMLISNLNTTYINSKNYTETHEKNLTDFFEELKIVPENMLDEQNNDIFGNNLKISSHIASRTEFGSRLFLYFWTLPNHSSVEECKTLFDIALQYESAWATVLNENTIRKLGGILSICGKAAPADYAEWMHCKPYNIGEIAENCNVCAKQKCDIKLIINNGI